MDQKEEIIKIYQKEEISRDFDKKRDEFLFQKYKHKIESDFLKETIKKINREKVKILDVACGTGRMLNEIFSIQKEIEYIGLDTSEEMTKILKRRAKEMEVSKRVKLNIGDATDMPFEDNTFDISYTYHLTWHLPQELQIKIIKEMIRVTKKGGYVLFDVLNSGFLWEKIKKLLGKKQTEGIYKINIHDLKKILFEKEYEIEKLNDFPIKNSLLYNLLNIINSFRSVFPISFFHMIYFRLRK